MLATINLAVGFIAVTVAIQAVFMSFALRVFRRFDRDWPTMMVGNPTTATVILIVFLMIPIALDVVFWASFYHFQAALPDFETALYFSTVTFTTVGYGDVVLGKEWRLIASFEAINGWIIFGWTTALIMAFIQRAYFRNDS